MAKRILVVEDNLTNQLIAKKLLEKLGFDVEVANDGAEAVQKVFDQDHFDAVLMDVQMPVMDGYEATRNILNLSRELPVIAMAADSGPEDIRLVHEAGMVDHVLKPVVSDNLYQVLKKWTGDSEGVDRHGSQPWNAGFPIIVGVDTDEGLLRTRGDVMLYSSLLMRFSADHRNFADSLASAIDGEDMLLARRQVHTLKGAALTVGAAGVGAKAAALESVLRQESSSVGEGMQRQAELLQAELLMELNLVLEAIDSADVKALKPESAGSGDSVTELLKSLVQLLSEQDVAARDVARQLETIWPLPNVELIGEAVARINDYQFEEALVLIRHLMESIGLDE